MLMFPLDGEVPIWMPIFPLDHGVPFWMVVSRWMVMFPLHGLMFT